MTDPYAILGVAKTATLEEIKSAYKKLARKYHPDLNPGNKKAESKFKDVAHAFDLVGTEEKRAKYDRGETEEQQQERYDDYMKSPGQRKQRPFYHQTQGDSGRYSSSYGGIDEDIFTQFFGGKGRTTGLDFPGEDTHYHLEIDFLEAARGAEKIINLPNGKKLQVKIPAGIQAGQKLKFADQGEPGIGKGPAGNAYVEIGIRPSPHFRREGKDIITELPLSFFEAANGAEVEVETIDGPVMLTIPAGVSTGTKLRIKEKGAGSGEGRGHQVVSIKVVMPKDPPIEMKEALKNLAQRFAYDPRGHQ